MLNDTSYSRDQRVEDNLHLATIGFEPVNKSDEALFLWRSYLGAHNLASVNTVGTGLPDALRHRGGARQAVVFLAARALGRTVTVGPPAVTATVGVPQAAGGPPFTTAGGLAESATVGLGRAGPSTAAFRAAPSGPRETPRRENHRTLMTRQVEDAIISAALNNDETLLLALHYRRENLPDRSRESDRTAITRLAVQFLDFARPRASAHEALIELARASWDVDAALDSWDSNNGDGVENDDGADDQNNEGQPPKKKQRLHDTDAADEGEEEEEEEEEEEGNGKGKGKGKSKLKGKQKGKGKEKEANE